LQQFHFWSVLFSGTPLFQATYWVKAKTCFPFNRYLSLIKAKNFENYSRKINLFN
jgi:hypothetical protein